MLCMITGRPKPSLNLAPDEQTQLRSLAASRTLPHALVARAKPVLWSAQGQSNTQIAHLLRWRNATVGKVALAVYRASLGRTL
jgi:putative transposase